MQEKLKSKTEGKARILANETKATIKDKIEGIEKLNALQMTHGMTEIEYGKVGH